MKFSIFLNPTDNPSLAFHRDIVLLEHADELGYDWFFIGRRQFDVVTV